MLLSELGKRVGASFNGNDIEISNIETLQDAKTGDISFLFNKKYINLLSETKASAIILPDWAPHVSLPNLRSKNPHLTYARVMRVFKNRLQPQFGISSKASITEDCEISKDVQIAPFVFIGKNVKLAKGVVVYPNTTILDNVSIGENTIIYSNVSISENTQIGDNTVIHSSVVIGSDGFGFAKSDDGSYEKIPHSGGVVIGNNVEIGAGSTIDRASFGNTYIRDGAKIDNLVHIAHSVEVGKNVLLVAQVGISGSSKIGDNSIMAGKASLTGHISVGKNCTVGPLAAVNNDLEDGSVVGGAPAFEAGQWKRATVAFKRLPDLLKDIRLIKKHLKI